jgi:hypothetical protein
MLQDRCVQSMPWPWIGTVQSVGIRTVDSCHGQPLESLNSTLSITSFPEPSPRHTESLGMKPAASSVTRISGSHASSDFLARGNLPPLDPAAARVVSPGAKSNVTEHSADAPASRTLPPAQRIMIVQRFLHRCTLVRPDTVRHAGRAQRPGRGLF